MSNHLPRRIRGLRTQNSMTIPQLADLVGASEKTVSNYELGKREPGITFLARLCKATGGDLLELIELQLQDAGMDRREAGISDDRGRYSVPDSLGPMNTRLAMSIMPTEWAVLLTELTMRGMLTTDGAIRIAEFFDDWQPSEQWLQYMEEAK